MSDAPWTVGRYVVETLAANGIDTVFGIPGVHNLELYRGLELARLRHVLARHEQNAGFAADGYARATRHPAAAFVISGPGLTNALTALAQAFSDSVPLLLVASAPLRASLGRGWGVLHELADQRALAAGVTRFAGSARSDEECASTCAARSPRCARARRAPYLDIPLDLLAAPTALRPEVFPARPQRACAPARGRRRASLLASAQRPLIVAGGGARAAGGSCGAWSRRSTRTSSPRWRARAWSPEIMRASLGASLPYRADARAGRGRRRGDRGRYRVSETDIYTTTRLPMRGTPGAHRCRCGKLARPLRRRRARCTAMGGDACALLTRGLPARARLAQPDAGDGAAHRARIERSSMPTRAPP